MPYWETRQEQAYKAGELTVNEYFKSLEKAFNTAKRKLRQAVSDFYTEYANENGLSYADAQKALSKAEIGELKDFIDLAMENIGKVNQEVNNMSIKARVTRYEALESQIDALLRELYAIDYESKAKESMRTIYRDSYYRTWYNIDKYNGFHKEFAQVQPRVIDQLIQYPFNGKNFSDRLWKQKDHLQEQLMESVTTMLVQGKPPQNLAGEFAKKLDAKKMDAYRLLHTESSYLMSEATHAGYQEDGVERYQILATLDSKTCGVCGKLDGKIYPVSEAVTGKNKPPFHPFCRCTDVPYYPDTPAEGRTRTARDENGKNIEVPADMTYEEWKRIYIEKANKSDIMKLPRATECVIPIEKFTEYALNPKKDPNKAKAFESALGYTTENADELVKQIRSKVQKYNADERGDNGYGMTYQIIMDIDGPNGKSAKVLTAWIDDRKKGETRLTTVHIDKRKD